jgi:hypothetical protein
MSLSKDLRAAILAACVDVRSVLRSRGLSKQQDVINEDYDAHNQANEYGDNGDNGDDDHHDGMESNPVPLMASLLIEIDGLTTEKSNEENEDCNSLNSEPYDCKDNEQARLDGNCHFESVEFSDDQDDGEFFDVQTTEFEEDLDESDSLSGGLMVFGAVQVLVRLLRIYVLCTITLIIYF